MFSSLAMVLALLALVSAGAGLYTVLDPGRLAAATLMLPGVGALFIPAVVLALASIVLAGIGLHLSAKLLGGLAMAVSIITLVAGIALFFVYDGLAFFQTGGSLEEKFRYLWDVFKSIFQAGVKTEVINAVNNVLPL